MRGLRASIMKDLKLFFSKTGVISILLPLVLLLVLEAAGGDLVRQAYVKPFPIAVRDEDNTVMSRSLISQISEVALFSEVIQPQPQETDDILLERGCAAVVTIPKDFFYDMYTMEQGTVHVTLHDKMPLEVSLFRSVLSSVMEIVRSEQAAARTVFSFCYGELSKEEKQMMWESTSEQLLWDTLGRHKVFEQTNSGTDIQEGLERGFFACALSLMCLFFSFSAVRTLPDEITSGVLPRYLSAGGTPEAFFLSKFIAAVLMMVPSLSLLLVFFKPERWMPVLLLSAVLFIASFGLLLCVTAWAGEEGTAQRWSNFVMLFSLLLGGAIYSNELLPAFAQTMGRFTVPYYARMGLELIASGEDEIGLLRKLLPLVGIGFCFTIAAIFGFFRNSKQRSKKSEPWREEEVVIPAVFLGFWNRLCLVMLQKIKAISGGLSGLVCLLIMVSIGGGIASYALGHNGAEELRLAVVLESDDKLAYELLQRLDAKEGVSFQIVKEQESIEMLSRGDAEGILHIGADYEEALWQGKDIPLSYRGADFSVSEQAAREIVAGEVISQLACIRALKDTEVRLNRMLTEDEAKLFWEKMEEELQQAPFVYTATMKSGHEIAMEDPFVSRQMGFAALVVMLTMLTWGAWVGKLDTRRVEQRMFVLPRGRQLSYFSDVMALSLIGLAVGMCSMLPKGHMEVTEWTALIAYVWCVSGLSLTITRLTAQNGRIDALAPFLVIVTCLVGGCFGGIDKFSPVLRIFSFFTPQGLALRAQEGNWIALAILIFTGSVLLRVGAPSREGLE